MGIKIDITPKDLKTLQALLKKHLSNTVVWAFGSRVKFTANPNSDLDLVAFITSEQETIFSLLKDVFLESNLPFKVDLHNWDELPKTFHKNIESNYVEIQSKTKSEVPSNWKKYKLGDLITLNYGKSLIAEKRIKGNIPVYSSAGVSGWHNAPLVESSGVLVGRKGNVGSVFYSKEPFFCIDTAYYVLPDENYDLKFMYYKLLSMNLIRLTSDSAVPGLNRETAYAQEVIIPDLPTQTKIAQILTSFDDKIELLGQMNQTLEATAQAIFKEWFVDFNFPGFDGELVDGLPKGWRMGKLEEEFDLIMGQSPKGETYNQDGNGMVFYQGRTDFGFRFPTNRLFTTEPNRKADILDTLVSVRAPVGDINMANETCCIGRGLSSVRHKTKAFSYTYYLMKSIEVIFKGFESEGTVFGSINKSNFEDIEILVPELKLVQEFEMKVNPIDYKILENSNQIHTFSQLRDSLLPKLMSGQIETV